MPDKTRKFLISIFGLLALAIIVALLSPADATLGNIAKFIYVHAALSWAAVGFLVYPDNPIFSSKDLNIKLFPLILTAIFLAMVVQIARHLKGNG